jgi:myosin-crossreactive antigen
MAYTNSARAHAVDRDPNNTKVTLIGGGIASLAAAVFLIRDGDIPGRNITIFEELDTIGGSLDGSGSPETGYVLRGGRMLESKYLCTFDLFSSIPTLDGRQACDRDGNYPFNVTATTASVWETGRRCHHDEILDLRCASARPNSCAYARGGRACYEIKPSRFRMACVSSRIERTLVA